MSAPLPTAIPNWENSRSPPLTSYGGGALSCAQSPFSPNASSSSLPNNFRQRSDTYSPYTHLLSSPHSQEYELAPFSNTLKHRTVLGRSLSAYYPSTIMTQSPTTQSQLWQPLQQHCSAPVTPVNPTLDNATLDQLSSTVTQHLLSEASPDSPNLSYSPPFDLQQHTFPPVPEYPYEHHSAYLQRSSYGMRVHSRSGDHYIDVPWGLLSQFVSENANFIGTSDNGSDRSAGIPLQDSNGTTPWATHQTSYTDLRSPYDHQTSVPVTPGAVNGVQFFPPLPSTIPPYQPAPREDNPDDADVKYNPVDEHYVWSYADSALYEVKDYKGQMAAQIPENPRITFPAGTYVECYEKDGSRASPAFRIMHPHSNTFIKAQRCASACPYRGGVSTLKRPITARDHFRKCIFLEPNHPLKLLCSLQLEAHERTAQMSQKPNKRKRSASATVANAAKPKTKGPIRRSVSGGTRAVGATSSIPELTSTPETKDEQSPSTELQSAPVMEYRPQTAMPNLAAAAQWTYAQANLQGQQQAGQQMYSTPNAGESTFNAGTMAGYAFPNYQVAGFGQTQQPGQNMEDPSSGLTSGSPSMVSPTSSLDRFHISPVKQNGQQIMIPKAEPYSPYIYSENDYTEMDHDRIMIPQLPSARGSNASMHPPPTASSSSSNNTSNFRTNAQNDLSPTLAPLPEGSL